MTTDQNSDSSKGDILKALHYNGQILVLPNIWDPLGALLLEDVGFPAVATASAAIASGNGYPDGEKIPLQEVIQILRKIVSSVKIPVTADIESGYACDNRLLTENIKQLLDTGIAGINIEETCHTDGSIFSVEVQCERIRLIRKAALDMGVDVFINARTDVYLRPNLFPPDQVLEEAIRRGKAFRDAGADGFYPILLKDRNSMAEIIREVSLPLNVLLLPDTPEFDQLKEIGVARVSLGPGFLRMAIATMKNTAEKLLHHQGMNEVKQNPVTGAYLNQLIGKNREA